MEKIFNILGFAGSLRRQPEVMAPFSQGKIDKEGRVTDEKRRETGIFLRLQSLGQRN